MPDNQSNGHSDSNLPRTPRVAPPEGQRAARGTFSSPQADEIEEIEWTPAEMENQEWNAAVVGTDSREAEVNQWEENDSAMPQPDEQTVADVPPIEDTYEPPLGLELDDGITNGGSGYGGSGTGGGNGGGGSGDDGSGSDYYNPSRRPDTPKDVELGLMEHLNELRIRLLYCAAILCAGMCITWNLGIPLQDWFAAPIRQVLSTTASNGTSNGNQLVSNDPTGFFSIYFQFSMISALILTAPFLFWQVWRFIEPALTNSERRYTLVLVPFSSVLFFMGAGLGYAVSPLFYKFFIAFQPTGVAAMWDYGQSIVLMAKMLLVFGLAFQVPVIVIFLNKMGVLSRNLLIEYWRHAVVVIYIVVAVLTPTWDPVTLTVCATPPCLLYVLSIWLVKWL